MAEKYLNGTPIIGNIVSSLIAAGVVGLIAYYGISSSIAGAVDARLTKIESEVARLREAQEAATAKRVSDLEAEVIVLKAQLQDLREQRRLNQ